MTQPSATVPSASSGAGPQQPLAIEAHGLTKQFGTRRAVANLNFSLPQGAFLSIFGHNGAGKTTLLRMLATLSKPSGGTCTLLGYDLSKQARQARSSIALVSHGSMLYPDLSALENLVFYGRMYGIADPQARARQVLELVDLDHRRFDSVRTFSRGMTQRLSIARALLADPQLILLDEPYSGLDPRAIAVLDALIARLRIDHTILMVSHDVDKGLALATHVLVLDKGRAIVKGAKADLTADDLTKLRQTVAGETSTRPIPGTAETPAAAPPTAPAPAAVRPVGYLRQYRALLAKDLRREFRTHEMLTSMGLYSLMVLLVFGIALAHAGSQTDIVQMSGGLLWALIVFSSLLGLGRSFAFEKEQDCLDGLLLIPMDRSAVFMAKATGNFLFLLVVEIIATLCFCFFFLSGYQLAAGAAWIAAPLLVGTIGIAALGTLLSTITANTRGRDVILAILFVPLSFPLLYACVAATTAALVGASGFMDTMVSGLAIAGAYDVIVLVLGWVLYDSVISA